MNNLRVLQIIDSLNTGGAEVLSVNIANLLSKKGLESHLCSTRLEGNLLSSIHKNVGYIHLNKNTTVFPWLLFLSLSIHSILEGIPIKVHDHLIYGIIIHKLNKRELNMKLCFSFTVFSKIASAFSYVLSASSYFRMLEYVLAILVYAKPTLGCSSP